MPSSVAVSERMSRQAIRDTLPEMALRKELHRRGLRFRVGRKPLSTLRSTADIVFGPAKVAVYVDGCFWHSCPQHATRPATNGAWWDAKLMRNQVRDRAIDRALQDADWVVIRVWEHEDPIKAADRVVATVRYRSPRKV